MMFSDQRVTWGQHMRWLMRVPARKMAPSTLPWRSTVGRIWQRVIAHRGHPWGPDFKILSSEHPRAMFGGIRNVRKTIFGSDYLKNWPLTTVVDQRVQGNSIQNKFMMLLPNVTLVGFNLRVAGDPSESTPKDEDMLNVAAWEDKADVMTGCKFVKFADSRKQIER